MSVYVIGSGSTKCGELFDKSWLDLALEAGEKAMKDAGIKNIAEIDEIYVATMLAGQSEGQAHAGAVVAGALGAVCPAYRVEAACASGGLAVNLAYKSVKNCEKGKAKKILVIGAEKMTDHDPNTVNGWLAGATGQAERESGISFAGLYALMANAYLEKYDLPNEILHFGPAMMHENGVDNPNAHFRKSFSPEQIGKSKMVASPLTLLDCSPLSDGAAAIILCSESLKSKIELIGSEAATMPPEITKRKDITSIKSTKVAFEKLKANNAKEVEQISIAEVHDCFSIGLIMAMEDLNFAEKGQGGDMLKKMQMGQDLGLKINQSGGLKAAGHPVGATGVKQIAYLAKNMTEPGQVGLSHNIGGTGGTAVLHLLKNIS